MHNQVQTQTADLTFREALDADAGFAARVLNENFPDEPTDEHEVRWDWNREADRVSLRYVALTGQEPVGIVAVSHQPWERLSERAAYVAVDLLPAARTPARFAQAMAFGEGLAREDGAEFFRTYAMDYEAWRLELLPALGYESYGAEEFRELDLAAGRDRILAMRDESRERMAEQGIELLPLSAVHDPDKFRKLHATFVEAELDVPNMFGHAPDDFESYQEELNSPFLGQDRVWVARVGDRLVGESRLAYPVESGNVWTWWTGVARAFRNRGIARALKLETFGQALEFGITKVRTGNDEENGPMIHINDRLGYVRIPGSIRFRKPAA